MALQVQNIPISFTEGLDTKDDYKQVLPGKFLTLQNAVFTSPGELRKRNGYTALPQTIDNGGNISQGFGLATFNNELLEFNGSQLFSYSASNSNWINKGGLTGVSVSARPVIRNNFQQTVQDMAQSSTGLQCFTWTDSRGSCRYSIYDSVTGQAVVQDTALVSTSVYAKPFVLGQYFIILYVDTSTYYLRYVAIPLLNPLAPAAPVTATIGLNTTNYDYDACIANNKLYIAFNSSTGGGAIEVFYINNFLGVSPATAIAGQSATDLSTTFDFILNQVWVAWSTGTSNKYVVLSQTLSSTFITGPVTIDSTASTGRIVTYPNNGSAQFWYELNSGTSYNTLIRTTTGTNTGATGTPGVFLRSVGLATKPFVYNGVVYLNVTYQSVQQPTYFTVNANAGIVAKEQPLNGGGLLVSPLVPEAVQVTPGIISFALLQKDLFTTESGTVYTQTGVTAETLNFNSVNTFYKAQIAQTLQLTGGVLSTYDGVNVVETGFNVYPEEVTNTNSTTGGNLGNSSVATQYQYSVCYEWTDNQGQINRSFPSIPDANSTVNFASGVTTGSVTLTIPTLRLTKKPGVVITIYRTQGNGSIFYQLTNIGINNVLTNSTTVDSVTYTDQASDASIAGNPILYTTGNVVGNDAPPAPLVIAQYINRLMLVPSENPLQIYYSEEAVPGTPLQFSDLFTLNIDARGGPITALQQMDTYLLIFKFDRVFYISGEGPDNTGAQNDFGNAQLITTDSGCINANSLVTTPVGVMYQSDKGIYLMNRNLTVEYIGAPVESYNSQTITAAQLIPTTNQVRFTLNDGTTCLVYDYYVKQWSIFTNHNANDAVIFEELFTFVQPTGAVWQETPGVFNDNGNFIQLNVVTSWLSVAQLQGFQRCYRALFLGQYVSPHQLLVSVGYDFNPNTTQQTYINPGTLFSITDYGADSPYGSGTPYGGAYPLYEFRVDMERQKCTAIQFGIQDIQSSNFGEGLALSGFNLTVGVKKGTNKLQQPNIYS